MLIRMLCGGRRLSTTLDAHFLFMQWPKVDLRRCHGSTPMRLAVLLSRSRCAPARCPVNNVLAVRPVQSEQRHPCRSAAHLPRASARCPSRPVQVLVRSCWSVSNPFLPPEARGHRPLGLRSRSHRLVPCSRALLQHARLRSSMRLARAFGECRCSRFASCPSPAHPKSSGEAVSAVDEHNPDRDPAVRAVFDIRAAAIRDRVTLFNDISERSLLIGRPFARQTQTWSEEPRGAEGCDGLSPRCNKNDVRPAAVAAQSFWRRFEEAVSLIGRRAFALRVLQGLEDIAALNTFSVLRGGVPATSSGKASDM